jgi:hypothetical protein
MNHWVLSAAGLTIALAGILFTLALIFWMGREAGRTDRAYKGKRPHHANGLPAALVPVSTAVTFLGLTLVFVAKKRQGDTRG